MIKLANSFLIFQQVLRTMRDQQAQEAAAAAAAAAEQVKSGLHLKWTETKRSAPFLVESLADIQAQQYRQFIKVSLVLTTLFF